MAIANDPIIKERRATGVRNALAQPDVRARHLAGILAAAARPGAYEGRGEKISLTLNTYEVNARLREAIKAAKGTPEARLQVSVKMKEVLSDPAIRIKMKTPWITDGISNRKLNIGEDLPDGWKFGRSFKLSEEAILAISEKKTVYLMGLSQEKRSSLARAAARARWDKEPPK